jgi:hypothetical protein
MSGFLGRLIARHTDGPSIRPRVAARFEPVAGPLSDPIEAQVPARRSPAATATLRPAAPLDSPAARADRPPAPPVEHRAAPANQSRRQPSPQDQRSALGDARLPSPPAANDRPSLAADARRAVSPAADQSTTRDAVLFPTVERIRPRRSSPSAIPVARVEPRIASPRVAPRPGSRRADVETAAPREPDVVQVHIGRVEVRAILPPTPAPQPPPDRRPEMPRPLSLERYLAGERRA